MNKSPITIAIFSAVAILSAGCGRTLTDEQKKELESLKSSLTTVQSELTAAEQRQKTAGGLIGAMMELRVETLKVTKELTEQRIAAMESGASIKVVVPVTTADPELAEKVSKEISALEQSLVSSRLEAAGAGGLFGMIKQTKVATEELTLAQLQQKHLAAKYGLALLPASASASRSSAPTQPDTKAPPKPSKVSAGDGPFGLVMGMTEGMFNGTLNELKPGIFEVMDVPVPNSDFSNYIVHIGPRTGLCWIKAIGKQMPTNSFGHQLRSQFDDLEARLSERYGQGKKTDLVIPGSIWKNSNDWMMALAKEERFLMKTWEGDKASLPTDLRSVAVYASASSNSEGRVNVEYAFSNEGLCEKEISAGNSKGL